MCDLAKTKNKQKKQFVIDTHKVNIFFLNFTQLPLKPDTGDIYKKIT